MTIASQQETIQACRFCFMCRHLSAVANVTFREADTPRGRALLLGRAAADPSLWDIPEYPEAIYQADLSAACRQHCVSHYDEVGLVLAARQFLVESGRAPAVVAALAKELEVARITVRGEGPVDVVYYVDEYTERHHPEIAAAMEFLLKSAGLSYRVVAGADSGKALAVLGYNEAASKLAAKLAAALVAPEVKTVVVSCPAAYDAFVNDYPRFGTPLTNVGILHSSELIDRLFKDGRLRGQTALGSRVFPLASDFLKNYNEGKGDVRSVLAAMGVACAAFGTNPEESYTAGEGAVVLDRLNPFLVEKLSRYIVARMDGSADALLTFSPYTKYAIKRFGGHEVRVTTLEEMAAAWVTGKLARSNPDAARDVLPVESVNDR